MIKRISFRKSKAKGHILGGNSPAILTNLYVNEVCNICEEDLEDETTVLRDNDRESRIICEECAYCIHCDYESQL